MTDFFTAKFKKEEGAKAIKSLKLVSKKVGDVVSDDNFYFYTGAAERWGFIEGEMKEGFTDDETKIKLTATYKAKDNLEIASWGDKVDRSVSREERQGHRGLQVLRQE